MNINTVIKQLLEIVSGARTQKSTDIYNYLILIGEFKNIFDIINIEKFFVLTKKGKIKVLNRKNSLKLLEHLESITS